MKNNNKLNKLIDALSRRQLLNWMPDELYLRLRFRIKVGYKLKLHKPVTFNEKLQWLKIFNRDEKYTQMVDKLNVKKYVSDTIGNEYVIPNIAGPWKSVNDIVFDDLPEKFVLKCTHDSGGTVICTEKKMLDIEKAKRKLSKSLRHNYYWQGREWPYKGVIPLIIAEQYIAGEDNIPPVDYKLMCFNGKVKCSFTVTNRFSKNGICVNFYDEKWQPMPFIRHYPKNPEEIACPNNYNKMVELAEKLSSGIPFVRVDFFEVNGKVYFGEMTFFPGGGMEEFCPEEWDSKLGDWIELPKITR